MTTGTVDISSSCLRASDINTENNDNDTLINPNNKRSYNALVGAIYHRGQSTRGHYTALVRSGENTYLGINDEIVSRRSASAEDISNPKGSYCKNCYILFYE